MIGRLAVLFVLISSSQCLSLVVDLDPMQDPPSATPSGLPIVQFSYSEKLVREQPFRATASATKRPNMQPDPFPGPVVRNETDITPSRDLSERMRDLRDLSRPISLPPVFVKKFLFRAQIKNETSKTVKRFVWTYQPQSTSGEMQHKDYVCSSGMKPGSLQKFEVLSPIPSQTVVTVSESGQPDPPLKPVATDFSIKFVDFDDGSSWQDPSWNSTSLLTRMGTRKLGQGKCTVL